MATSSLGVKMTKSPHLEGSDFGVTSDDALSDASPPEEGFESGSSQKRPFSVNLGQSAEQYMSQLLSQKRYKLGDDDSDDSDEEENANPGACAGFIRKLTLKNFMCHDHFELEFGSQMNFIVGRNGSGKSAVLTGLSVGLGAKATDTSRGLSIRSLIKDGKSMARVVVELSNVGSDAYEPETFGSVVIVERKFTRDGTNAYYIKSENGTVVSNKKKVLDEILQKFLIVVNNPLSFLSQDKAREFIASSTEKSRFTYFSEGTNIQSIIKNYQEASRNILNLQTRQATAKQYYEEACKKYAECERGYRKFKHSHTLRQQLEKINGKIYWFNVDVVGRKIKWEESEIKDLENEKLGVQQETESRRTQIMHLDENIKEFQEKEGTAQEDFSKAKEHNKVAGEESDQAAKELLGVRSELLNYKHEIEDLENLVDKHKNDIITEQKKIDEANGGSHEAMEQRLKVLKVRSEQFVSKRDEIQNRLLELESQSPELEALNQEYEELVRARKALEEKLRGLERAKNDNYAAFGINIKYLVRDIEKESRWHKKPIGPLGYYVLVKSSHSKYNDLINAALLNTLDSFVVYDEHDRRLLNQLMREKKVFKRIIVRKFEHFGYKENTSGYDTILDALDIQNEDVKFTLIDASSIEDSALCESLLEAETAAGNLSIARAFCLNDRKSGTRITRGDEFMTRDPVFYPRDLPKLAGKVSLGSISEDLKEAVQKENQVLKNRTALKQKEHESRRALQNELTQKKSHIKEINNQIFEIETSLNEEGDSGRIESLNAQIEMCRKQIQTKEGMSMELLAEFNQKKEVHTAAKSKAKEARNAEDMASKKISDIQDRIDILKKERDDLEAEMERFKIKLQDLNKKLEAHNETKDQDSAKKEELCRLAQERCDRSEVTIKESDTTESITEEFRSIQRAIEEAERSNTKTFEEIQKEVLDSKAVKDKCEESLIELEDARVTLENDLNFRFENLNITIKEKLTRAKLSFEQSLALRGFKGKLEFDFANKRVVTEVQTKDDKDTRAVLSLSGGEKSFTQIAFLLSIWKVMKPRVCGLDEFDVFMDSVNRTIAIRLLIHELRDSSAQSIFITPQDIAVVGDLKDSEDVKIHVISPPRTD